MILSIFTFTGNDNLIDNGSFENNARCLLPWCIKTDTSFIKPWTVVGGNGQYEIDRMWRGDGVWSMDLSADLPVTIQQIVAKAIPGKQYKLSALLNANRCGKYSVKTGFIVVFGATTGRQNFSYDSISLSAWVPVTYTFTAPANGTALQIGSTVADSCGPVIDGMKMTDTADSTNTNILENGSFEDHASCGEFYDRWCIQTTADLITPWTVAGGNGEFEIDNRWFGADTGTWSMDLSANTAVTVQQVLTRAVPGTSYTINFKLNGNRDCGNPVKTGFIQVLGATAGKQSFSYNSTANADWQTVSYIFTAPSNGSILQVGSTIFDDCGPVIDAFTMYPTVDYVVMTVTDDYYTTKHHTVTVYYDDDLQKVVTAPADIQNASATIFTTIYTPVVVYVNMTLTDITQTVTPATAVSTLHTTSFITIATVTFTATA